MSATIGTLGLLNPYATAPTASAPDAQLLNNFFTELVAAVRAMMQQQQQLQQTGSRYERGGADGMGLPRPSGSRDSTGRMMPNITGFGW